MSDYDRSAGQLLRKLRQQRNLTLKQAALLLQSSAPVLSRKERGTDPIERADIRLAIEAYQLSAWEAYRLWMTAGFIPEPSQPPARSYDLREFTETLLPNLPFPAFVLDMLGYLMAWNEGIEAIWHPSQTESARIHVMDELFTEQVRQRLRERWDGYVLNALRVFYHRTLPVANDPAFRALLEGMRARHGEAFVEKWNEAQRGNAPDAPPPVALGETIVSHESPLGMIDYLVMQSTIQFPLQYDLIMYVPFGRENQQRYEEFKATMGPNRLYFVAEAIADSR